MKSLYIHIPFCKSKCKYCAFYSITSFNYDLISKYLETLLKELNNYENRMFDTIYIGGGTPSVIPVKLFEKFLNNLFNLIEYKGVEFTVEINPESISEEHLILFKNYFISRISLGVQSLDDNVLSFLGRIHNSDDVYKAMDLLNMYNFQTNIDLIYDIPTISLDNISNTLEGFLRFKPNHISAYSYSFDTNFLSNYKNISNNEEQYNFVVNFLESNGFIQYEVSNFSLESFESKHNINYWQMGEYVGVGASAHSMIYENTFRRRFANTNDINKYIKNPNKKDEDFIISKDEMLKEDIIFGLRVKKGINIDIMKDKFGKSIDILLEKLEILLEEQLLELRGGYLCATKKGYLLLDSLSQYIWELEL